MQKPAKADRIEALDYLRGFFIIVIIIDHLYRWPSFLSIFTGEGLLWANASDGFIIISGLLTGYIRGYKYIKTAFREVATKLMRRAVMLYLWGVGVSIALAAVQWLVPFKANMPGITSPPGDWWLMIQNAFTLTYAHPWIYFLHLYAIFMLLAVVAVWLLRRNLAWAVVALSLAGFAAGHFSHIEWLERQVIFFVPAAAGFYLDSIGAWVRRLGTPTRRALAGGIAAVFAATVGLSALWRFHPGLFRPEAWQAIDMIFSRSPMGIGAVLISFVWFVGLFVVFQLGLPPIKRYLRWLVLPFGHHSLAAYIIHGVPVIIISFFLAETENVFVNTVLGVVSVLIVIGLLKIPVVKRLLPR